MFCFIMLLMLLSYIITNKQVSFNLTSYYIYIYIYSHLSSVLQICINRIKLTKNTFLIFPRQNLISISVERFAHLNLVVCVCVRVSVQFFSVRWKYLVSLHNILFEKEHTQKIYIWEKTKNISQSFRRKITIIKICQKLWQIKLGWCIWNNNGLF